MYTKTLYPSMHCITSHAHLWYNCPDIPQAVKNACNSEGSQLPQTVYDELQLESTPEHQDMNELEENVSYGPIT